MSSAKSLTFPSGQHLYKSFMKSIKNKGPRTEPCGTPHVMGLSLDLGVKQTAAASRSDR